MTTFYYICLWFSGYFPELSWCFVASAMKKEIETLWHGQDQVARQWYCQWDILIAVFQT